MKNKNIYLYIIAAIVVIFIGLLIIFATDDKAEAPTKDETPATQDDGGDVEGASTQDEIDKEALAKYISNEGMVFFGSANCGHCWDQKEMFGDAFQYVDYVECTDSSDPNYNADECAANNITATPTWLYKGEKIMGKRSLEELAEISGYSE